MPERKHSQRHRNRLLLLAMLATGPAWADVLTVDAAAGPGSGYTDIQAAVDAALEGDTILVRDGTYLRFEIVSKSLTIVADGQQVLLRPPVGLVTSIPMIVVRDLAADQAVLVRGLRPVLGVRISDCQGSVWFDELECPGSSPTTCHILVVHGARVEDSARVTFTRCLLSGENATPMHAWGYTGASGLSASGSSVQLFDCTIVGGKGPDALLGPAIDGSAGLSISSSTVTTIGCTIVGGGGGLNQPTCSAQHAPGGAGVAFGAARGTLRSAETTAVGGVTSLEPLCPGQSGPQGPAISGSGTIVALPGFARHLRANGPLRAGETLAFELGGQPGELPLVLVSLEHRPLPLLNGALLVGLPPAEVFALPSLPASGEATLAFPVPSLAALAGGLTCYAQAVFLDPFGSLWLGAGTSIVLLAAGS